MSLSQSSSWSITKKVVRTHRGVVTSQSRIASEIGAQVLRNGGNVVDAAIATSFALGVAEPWMSGIGGGGFMVVRLAKTDDVKVINFGMKSPKNLDVEDYPLVEGSATDLFPWTRVHEDRNVTGALAVAIPGQVAGMGLAAEHFSSLPWKELIQPSIDLAKKGLAVDWYAQLIISSVTKDLVLYKASAETFLDSCLFPKSSAWTSHSSNVCDQSSLAKTLETIAEKGHQSFYRGELARTIVNELVAAGGKHCLEDFESYTATLQTADKYSYRDHTIFGTPSMTAGPTLKRTFSLMENWQPEGNSPDSNAYKVYDTAIRLANEERYRFMGDERKEVAPSCTTHFNVVDSEGNCVSVTQTLLSIFGSKLMLGDSGILMNNGIMWFDPEPNKPNSLAAGKRCLANMCPTILKRSDGLYFALGASGGRKIMPAVAQLSSFILDYKMDIEKAMYTPRIDTSLSDLTIVDDTMDESLVEDLRGSLRQVKLAPRTIYPFNFACPSIISSQVEDGRLENSGMTEVMSAWSDSIKE
ncbi:gamma-glutamyltransferase [Enterovibrio norvegicus FF-33]|uniref:Gamma-glutamyltransferase n=1 Tax=Enterovibrio norvegicus FF-454 TaxID=1185651 RepID=A0A1E5CE96_9GAMM|nr:gamma-glutamyltransferase [Enterovibrio norvegicus]OEE63854.1 gamma-glutamyltransferase [Enterovibrio norvegicus FF-454]OEE66148.1 gamma-glutamyltransferase [Enterovibrio norvegicus FF-33]OEE84464.1 gamma-glutamyltransferase [Enterovibrio norvegicus FF-162]